MVLGIRGGECEEFLCKEMAGLKEMLAKVLRFLLISDGDNDHGDGRAVVAGSLTLREEDVHRPFVAPISKW